MIPREHIVRVARSWVGVPYRHQGRDKNKNVDCVGLILGVGKEIGLPHLEAPDAYSPSPASNLVLQYCESQLVRMPTNDFALGRVAVMWGFDRNEAQHLAIIGREGGRWTMIHAISKRGKVVEHSWDTFWMKRLVHMYEYPDTRPLGE